MRRTGAARTGGQPLPEAPHREHRDLLAEQYRRRAEFVSRPDAYASPNPLHRRIFWRRLRVAQDLIALNAPRFGSALDFGTNQGLMIPFLVERFDSVCSVELREVRAAGDQVRALRGMLASLGQPCDRLTFTDIEPSDQALPVLRSGEYDCIVATDVLEHVPDVAALLATFERLLTPEGVALISLPVEHVVYKAGVLLNDVVFKTGRDRSYHLHTNKEIESLIRDRFDVVAFRSVAGFFHVFAAKRRSSTTGR